MIEVYSWATPNGHKVHIMLEECGLPYRAHPGRHRRRRPVQARVPGDQPEQQDPGDRRSRRARRQADLAVRIGRDPALPGRQDRHASCPPTCAASYEMLEWLMFQMGGVGPMLGQAHHFRIYAPEKIAYAIDRYTNEAKRLYGVMDKRLAKQQVHRRPTSTRSPTSRSSRGCARGRTRASTGPTTRTSRAGSTRSPRGPAVQRGVEVLARRCASRSSTTRRARCCSAPTQYQRH